MVRASSLLVGKKLEGDYSLRRLLGRGSFGSVWEAQTGEGRPVALKFMPCGDPLAASVEIRAIQHIRQLRHPHLIEIEKVWCHRGYIVVTMPLAEGSLQDMYEAYQAEFGTPIPAEETCLYLTQAARGLDFLNARNHLLESRQVGYQHCDIKPSNLLVFGDTVMIADFGLASPTTRPVELRRGAGTPEYMAPEVFHDRLSDWTDQFALAVSYCLLRGGRLPFTDSPLTSPENRNRARPDLSMLPAKEQAVVARAMSSVPPDRWPSCVEMMAELAKAAKPDLPRRPARETHHGTRMFESRDRE
jgi:serine/threonine-protein kinase